MGQLASCCASGEGEVCRRQGAILDIEGILIVRNEGNRTRKAVEP